MRSAARAGSGRVLVAQRGEQFGVVAFAGAGETRRLRERAVDAHVAQVDVQPADAGGGERRQQHLHDLAVGGDVAVAVQLGTDLQHLPRAAGAGGLRAQHTAGVAEAGDAGLVQQVRVDARNLRRRVGAQSQHAPRLRVDGLERQEVEVTTGARQQRIEELDQRRLHQPVPAHPEVVEQDAAQRLHARSFRGQHVLDGLGEEPLTHHGAAAGTARRPRSTPGRRSAAGRR